MNDVDIIDAIKQLMEDSPLSYFSRVFSRKNPQLRDYVLKHSAFLDGKLEPRTNKPYAKSTRIIYALNNFTDYPRCKTCNKPILRNLSLKDDLDNLFCCNRCAQKDPGTIARGKATKVKNHGDPNYNNIEKSKKTCLERYGVECSWQSSQAKESRQKTLVERYGVDHQMRSDDVKNGMRERYRAKHGVDYAFQDPDVIAKITAKNRENFGVDFPMQSEELRKTMHANGVKTKKTNFYYNVVMHDSKLEPLFGVDEWVEHYSCDKSHLFKWRCKQCGREIEQAIMFGSPLLARCYDYYPVHATTSAFEKDIASFINSLGNGIHALNRDKKNRQLISPNEIDIIVEKDNETKLLIEADGLYWHSVLNGKDKWYHKRKTDRCNALGYQLIHIFEDEWNSKRAIVESRLRNLLGIYSKVVPARKCKVQEIDHHVSKDFFNDTHIQGNVQASICLGLFYGEELVAAMSFGKRRKITNAASTDGEHELLRFSTKLGYHVIGGAGKLLAHFESIQAKDAGQLCRCKMEQR